MNTKTIILSTILFFSLLIKTKAQNIIKDNATCNYAILRYGPEGLSDATLDVVFDNSQFINLYKKLNLDTMKIPEGYGYDKFVLKGLNYLDALGFELVTSYSTKYYYEYIFRKK